MNRYLDEINKYFQIHANVDVMAVSTPNKPSRYFFKNGQIGCSASFAGASNLAVSNMAGFLVI